jgi:hypothetical protein
VSKYKPICIFTFGSFSYEFALRTIMSEKPNKYKVWDTAHLADKFNYAIHTFDISKTNIIPLLHRSIAGGRFPISHKIFTNSKDGNYFDYVGKKLSELVIRIGIDYPQIYI